MALKGIEHKNKCFKCKTKFENDEKIFNFLYLNEEDEIEKFTILCSKCFSGMQKNGNVIYWQTIFKKPFSKRAFINGLAGYFFANYGSMVDEKAKFIIAYLLYQQRILKIREQNEQEIIFENKSSKQRYKVQNFYGKISLKYVRTLFKDLWKVINSTSI